MEHLSAKEQELWNELWDFYCETVEDRRKGNLDYEVTFSEILAEMTLGVATLTRKQIRPLVNKWTLPKCAENLRKSLLNAEGSLERAATAFYDGAYHEMDLPF